MPNDDNKYRVVIQAPAVEMLLHHTRFLAKVSEAAAKKLADEFTKQAKTLETMPERCPWLIDQLIPEHKYRKLIFAKRYMLIFQVIGNDVYVDAMVDCRQEYSWLS